MAIKSYKLGPGTLNLGVSGTLIAVSAQVRSMTIKAAEKVEKSDPIPVLSGEELEGDESVTYDWTITGTVLQDIDVDGMVDWSWEHKGTTQPFEFIPSTAEGRKATGTVVPAPLDFGGDVDKTKRAESPLTWRLPAEPVLGVVV